MKYEEYTTSNNTSSLLHFTPSKKTTTVVNHIIDVMRNHNITTVSELLELFGCLGCQIGKSIISQKLDISSVELTPEVLKQLYLRDNDIGAATMLQSMMILHWREQLEEMKR